MPPDQAERRLAAIMFTDIVGSTAATARSESAGLALRDRHRALVRAQVERYRGRFIEAPGDESLSTFGSAVDAVSSALAIQSALRDETELRVRIGIHLGETMFRGDEVFGDGVNVAARVRELASPGEIVASAEVARAIQNQGGLESVDRGERSLKGVTHPVGLFAISGSAPEPGSAPRRRAERATLGTRRLVLAVAALLVLAATAVWWLTQRMPTTPSAIRSVAVLPLDNLSGDPEQEYFTDGMTEALIAELGKVRALHVTSRTSIMQYKATDKSLAEIARDLGVEAVVEGSVLRAGDRVRITAQLVNAPLDRHIWAESYERDLGDVLALQGEVARAIAREVQLELTPGERLRLSTARKTDAGAYEAYLKGRFFLNRHTIEGYRKAIEHFEEAIVRDPTSALAHSGLSDAYVARADYMEMRPLEVLPRARAAAARALELDDALAEAHLSWGRVRFLEWDWVGAEVAFKRAIELNPSDAEAHSSYGNLLETLLRGAEALAHKERAVELDPLSLTIRASLWEHEVARGRLDRAVEEILAALELEPDYVFGNLWLGMVYSYQSKHEQAIARLERTVALSGQEPALWPELGYAYARAGRTDEARQHIARTEELSRSRYVSPILVAEIYAALGERDRMFHWLERGYAERDFLFHEITWRRSLVSARSDPRFQDLLRRLGLPES